MSRNQKELLRLIANTDRQWPDGAERAVIRNDYIWFTTSEGSLRAAFPAPAGTASLEGTSVHRGHWDLDLADFVRLIRDTGGWLAMFNWAWLRPGKLCFGPERPDLRDASGDRVGGFRHLFDPPMVEPRLISLGQYEEHVPPSPSIPEDTTVVINPLLPLADQLEALASLMRDPDTPALTLIRKAREAGVSVQTVCEYLDQGGVDEQ